MKFTSFLGSLCLIIFACHQDYKTSSQIDYSSFSEKKFFIVGLDKELNQTDTLALISIKVPKNLDTFYHWYKTSDCLPCGRLQYRFANKYYKQFLESGFYWTYAPDSVYQLTIIHNPIKEVPDSIHLKPFNISDTNWVSDMLIHVASSCNNNTLFIKEFKKINDHGFILTGFTSPCSRITDSTSLFLVAGTILKNRYLNFVAECRGKDTVGFVDEIYKSLLSIKIQEK